LWLSAATSTEICSEIRNWLFISYFSASITEFGLSSSVIFPGHPENSPDFILEGEEITINFTADMALLVSSLNSGSNGNCYYIGTPGEAVLIDGGISCRETEKRLKRLSLSIKNVKAVFVSHEHGDHIHGVSTLCRKHHIPLYITPKTLAASGLRISEDLINTFSPTAPVTVGSLTITAFPKRHDACDPHSFVITTGQIHVGVFTDIGYTCENVVRHFQKCHAVFLESNYDEEMLERGRYPYSLKNRIRGGWGHLSNRQALKLFTEYKPAFMSHLFLSHLSRENNSPELAEQLFRKAAGRTEIVVASRYEQTPLFEITGTFHDLANSKYSRKMVRQAQLTLF
jgi:phosphoribosyl 1,2-cyclic phosphodiesterase